MSARLDSLESAVGGQGRQLNELPDALQDLQKQSNEWQAKLTVHMEETDSAVLALNAGSMESGAAGAGDEALTGLGWLVKSWASAWRRRARRRLAAHEQVQEQRQARLISPAGEMRDGCGRRSASAGAERHRDGPRSGGQGALAADGPFAVCVRGSKVDLTLTAKEKSYTEQVLPYVRVSQRGRFQFRASRFLGIDVHMHCVTAGDGLALLRQSRETKVNVMHPSLNPVWGVDGFPSQ